MFILLSVLMLLSHVFCLGKSLNCDESTEYAHNQRCCKKCKPGQFLEEKCGPSSRTVCLPCGNGYFTNDYNVQYKWCHSCTLCTNEHMKYEKNCTATSDAVCTCEDGYRCSNNKCETCVKVQTTTAFVPTQRIVVIQENVWISVSLCFACVCVCVLLTCFLLTSRHARTCGWIMSASAGLWSSKKSNWGSSQCTEEEEVPMPVQEMCGKTEKLEDV